MITNRKEISTILLTAIVVVLSACSSSSNTVDSEVQANPLPLDQLRDQLIIDLAGYPVETLSDEALLLGEAIAASAAPGQALTAGSFELAVRDENVVTATEKTLYNCPLGGTMTAEIGRLIINESSYSNTADHDSYQFNQCRIGEQLLDGTVRTLLNSVSASGGGFDNRDSQWTNFSWQQADGNVYEGTALVDINRLLSVDNQESRFVTIDSYEHSLDSQLINRITSGSMTLENSTSGSGFRQNFTLDTQGQVTSAANVAVQITTDVQLSAGLTPAGASDSAEPFSGVLSLTASDGGRLVMTAQPIVEFGPKLVDIVFTSSIGEITMIDDQTFPNLTIVSQ